MYYVGAGILFQVHFLDVPSCDAWVNGNTSSLLYCKASMVPGADPEYLEGGGGGGGGGGGILSIYNYNNAITAIL